MLFYKATQETVEWNDNDLNVKIFFWILLKENLDMSEVILKLEWPF